MANEKRLIDANALIKDWNKLTERMVRDEDGKIPVDFCLVIRELSKTPTVYAVEVVHGRWVFGTANHREYMKCSECLHSYTPDGTFCYCPNCGAKMDGDDNA